MLRELSIENLAVIEKASIAFDDKLNVFTGETGAGKSILCLLYTSPSPRDTR